MLRPPLAVLCSLVLPGCASAPAHPLPDPYPETLEFARSGAPGGGAFLGLEVRENDSGSLDELFFEPGVRVVGVVENSPAAQAGLAPGDVLLRVQEERVDDPGTLAALLAVAEPDSTATLEVRRGDSVFGVPVRLGARLAAQPTGPVELRWRADPLRSRAGWLAGHGGVVLVTSAEDGPFPAAGIPNGAVVLELEGEPVRSERTLIRRLHAMEPGARAEVLWQPGPGQPQAGGAARASSVRLFAPPRRVTGARVPILVSYEAQPDGSHVRLSVVDLWLVWLLRYERSGPERHWSLLRFLRFSSGVGELAG